MAYRGLFMVVGRSPRYGAVPQLEADAVRLITKSSANNPDYPFPSLFNISSPITRYIFALAGWSNNS
jgi:hypothetical protein